MPQLPLIALLFLTLCGALFIYKRDKRSPEDVLKELQRESRKILGGAIKKSQNILEKAEEEGLEIIDESKTASKGLSRKYEAELASVAEEMEKELRTQVTHAEKEFVAYLDSLKAKTEKIESRLESMIQARIEATFTNFDAKVTDLLSQTQSRSFASIEEELKNARRLVDEYKTQQMKLVDDNVIAILEKTINIVLAKKLTLRDQLDLVSDALEKAKIESSVS